MCGIAGIISTGDEDVGPLLRLMLKTMHHRGPNGAGYVIGDKVCRGDSVDDLDWEDAHGSIAMGHTRLAVTGGLVGAQPFLGGHGDVAVLHNGEVYNYEKLRGPLEEKYRFTSATDSEVLAHLIGSYYEGDLTSALEAALHQCDGVYAVACTDGNEVALARDKIGVRQLYLGQQGNLFAFSSEKKPLWALGIESIDRLLPDHTITISFDGIDVKKRNGDFMPDKATIFDPDEAAEAYGGALEDAILKRINNQDRVGVIFSGGIDSLLIAHMAQRLGAEVTCYASGHDGSSDLDCARTTADSMGLDLRAVRLSDDSVMALLPEIIRVIEDRSVTQVEVAIPIFAAVREAQQNGELVLLTGQGADELFGGYPWYRVIVEQEGYQQLQYRMQDDLLHLYKETLEREDKITMAHSMELRVPYLDPAVIDVAMSIAPEIKVLDSSDTLAKHAHRELAIELGIDREWAMRPKESAQHGAGAHELLQRLAARQGFHEETALKVGYLAAENMTEELGSSVRYGYKYCTPEMWARQDHVQLFLDWVAYHNDLLQEEEKFTVEEFLTRTGIGE
ncbi:MAG: hypothetical protein HYX91_03405 [Chloroflexi bacterium]|nr:hypothetical protein [Chloroflexota bacterium]